MQQPLEKHVDRLTLCCLAS